MTPHIVIVGRPNVGKSLLFNRLLKRRVSLVHNKPGMTLDFLREPLVLSDGKSAWLSDTGGVEGEHDEWTPLAVAQMQQAAADADLFLLVVDYRSGLLAGDIELAQQLRRRQVPWWLVINKAENTDAATAQADFHTLGAKQQLTLSAKHGSGLTDLHQQLAAYFPAAQQDNGDKITSVAVVGRPNVGKSTFINRLLGDARLAVSERPGTTRDTVSCRLAHASGDILLIDTAGISRQRAVRERDKLSIAATRRALAAADCAVLMLDIAEGVTYQDKRIAAAIEAAGCALTVVANKSDLLPPEKRRAQLAAALERLPPVQNPPSFMLSAVAKRQLPLNALLSGIRRASASAYVHLPTAQLNSALNRIVAAQAPRQKGRIRPKLRYAHQGGSRPPCIVIHGNAINRIDDSYRRYLASAFAQTFALTGNNIKIVFRSDENPYLPAN